jgi:hypothetical protein
MTKSIYYNHGKLLRDVAANGQLLKAGKWACVDVFVDNGEMVVLVASGKTNIYLPFYETDYKSLVTH